jgi:hypothetical protein
VGVLVDISVGLFGRGIGTSGGIYLHRTAHGHTSMPRAGFEPPDPVFERPKTNTLRGALIYYIAGCYVTP